MSDEIRQAYDYEWVTVRGDTQNIECCECGLRHTFKFRRKKINGKFVIQWQAVRHATTDLTTP